MNEKRETLEAILRDTDRRLQLARTKVADPRVSPMSVRYGISEVQDALTAATHQAKRIE